MRGFLAKRGFSSVQAEIPGGMDGVSACFYLEATLTRERTTDTTSETKSQPEQKGFLGFL